MQIKHLFALLLGISITLNIYFIAQIASKAWRIAQIQSELDYGFRLLVGQEAFVAAYSEIEGGTYAINSVDDPYAFFIHGVSENDRRHIQLFIEPESGENSGVCSVVIEKHDEAWLPVSYSLSADGYDYIDYNLDGNADIRFRRTGDSVTNLYISLSRKDWLPVKEADELVDNGVVDKKGRLYRYSRDAGKWEHVDTTNVEWD